MKPSTCQHCSLKPATRPRRLCWGCYAKPEVKALYMPLCIPGPQTEAELVLSIAEQGATMPSGKRSGSRF